MSQKAKAAVAEARKYLGYHPDPWRSQPSPIIDCSGLVQYCYKKVGVNLPRITYQQINCGKPVSRKNLQPGDLVFPHPGHVGIYTSNGKMIHFPKTGDAVKESNIWAFYAARRVA